MFHRKDFNNHSLMQSEENYTFTDTFSEISDLSNMQHRYSLENQLLQAVSLGQTTKAEQLLSLLQNQKAENRASTPLRNLQNYAIILNTLLRKAAEQGMVPALYLDKTSSHIGHKIEAATTPKSVQQLQHYMIRKYCLLVKNHSMKGYSLLVQKVLMVIDADISADLSLRTLALTLNINASYLSHLFKKETGTTITDYINKKRMEYSIYLLNSTTFQIQTIAQYCGITDVNYFTKLFKKYYGMTPSAYRKFIQQKVPEA